MKTKSRSRAIKIKVGEKAAFDERVTVSLLKRFGELSHDRNPLHQSDAFARALGFQGKVGYGMLAGVFFSRLIGMYLPGPGSVYLSQNIRFHSPMYPGMKVRVHGRITQKNDTLGVARMTTEVREAESALLLVSGEALVQYRHQSHDSRK